MNRVEERLQVRSPSLPWKRMGVGSRSDVGTPRQMFMGTCSRLEQHKVTQMGEGRYTASCWNTFTSEIATAMSPELQALEALKNESLLHCKVVQRVDELSEKHVRDYDALREKQYQELVKFVEACRKEKEDVVWDALYEKVKALLAVVERTGVGEDKDMSSEDILKRLFLNTVGACKQVEAKLSQVEKGHRGSLDRLPNLECAVCCAEFSAKRKRACLDPCGHASACVDCATQVWKKTKKCFVCKTSIGQPVGVPSKLFF